MGLSGRKGRPVRLGWVAAGLAGWLGLAGCGTSVIHASPTSGPSGSAPSGAAGRSGPSKVLLLVEENKTSDQVVGGPQARFLVAQMAQGAQFTNMDAGYPTECPSLAAYIILTSGGAQGICDDRSPAAHPLAVDNVFQQVAVSGREWRVYAESMSQNCHPWDAGAYAVRHTGATYYTSETQRCRKWQVPMGDLTLGPLHDDITSGTLPAYSLVVPDLCHDMHGDPSCPPPNDTAALVAAGDAWLGRWLPLIMAGEDYRTGRLVIILTWDEGSKESNHIPAMVFTAGNAGRTVDTRTTHCSMVRLTQEVLGVPLLGCAAGVPSVADAAGVVVGARPTLGP